MTTLTAMKQALAALEDANGVHFNDEDYGPVILDYSAPIADLRTAIAELENAEPVATIHDDGYWTHPAGKDPLDRFSGRRRMDVYAAPPAPAIPADWQPIETAPKDCRILIGRVGHRWVFSAWWNDRHEHWAIGPSPMDFFAEPTHWMPLPKPLTAKRPAPKE